ncbi:MAG: gamma-glutamyl-gamma-aminobutyrate hydrolase family protein [Acidimicrobiaceae bacterium]|nr:gamma-glutamyl-gamma-aminobutyrate hydrolase family protein [Acidimicrobiaceae bacterium]
MSRRPLIGITGRTKTVAEVNMKPDTFAHLNVDVYYCDYAHAVAAAGGLPVFLPASADPASYAHHLDGLLLSGGTDIEPHHYGQSPKADLYTREPARDAFELALLDGAAEAELPVLGICRGVQVMNVHGGGTLHQHVPPHDRQDQAPGYIAHRVDLTEGSLAASLYGPSLRVNSLHHQSVDRLAEGLEVTGCSEDGSVEVIESRELPWFGVQWHPELMDSRDQDPAFRWLVEAASGAAA